MTLFCSLLVALWRAALSPGGRGERASLEGLVNRCFQQYIPAPDDVDGRENDGDEQGVPDATGTKTGQVHHAVGKSVRCIDKIDEKGPSRKPYKSIADCHMEGRRDGFGEKSGNAAGFGAIEGEQIIQVIEDDERIIDGADQEKQTEKPDIMTALPRGAKGAAPRRHVVARPEVGIVTLECPPGEGEDHKEEDFCGASGDSAECCAGDDEKKCAETGCQGLEITTLKKLSCAGKKEREESGA